MTPSRVETLENAARAAMAGEFRERREIAQRQSRLPIAALVLAGLVAAIMFVSLR